MERIFISYKRVDKEKVFKIKDQIESVLGEKCWIDIDGIQSDAQFKNVIIKAINECEVVLFMYSKAHTKIKNLGEDWTVRELNFASRKNKRIVFVNIDGSTLTDVFEFDYGTQQQVDARSSEAMDRLFEDLGKWLSISSKKGSCEQPPSASQPQFHPFVTICIIVQCLLYVFFALQALRLQLWKPIPYNPHCRTLNMVVIVLFVVSLFSTVYLYKRKKWAYWCIVASDIAVFILITSISKNMTGKVLNDELLIQLHGYGRMMNFGSGFIPCVEFILVVIAHTVITYLVLQIKYKGQRAWELLK